MNSEGSGLGLQIHGGLTSQWFESTFCALVFLFGEECVLDLSNIFTTLISVRDLVTGLESRYRHWFRSEVARLTQSVE